ncbi:hypothetical protein E2C01_092967 [Portunus trituberculatus]|uniref:Uncharacterized protein n=1 Tax=Portunus trituberculatus TaxID=210409 RepID=A0A5B7JTA3_PORTR|nr:hypothetical protein [Portunus trituberculatus]
MCLSTSQPSSFSPSSYSFWSPSSPQGHSGRVVRRKHLLWTALDASSRWLEDEGRKAERWDEKEA